MSTEITGPKSISQTPGLPDLCVLAFSELAALYIGPQGGGGSYYYKDKALCARENGKIIGFVNYRYEEGDGELWVMLSWVDIKHRRTGVFRLLWARLVEEARKLGAVRICGTTHLDNIVTRAMYRNLGRVETHVVSTFEVSEK